MTKPDPNTYWVSPGKLLAGDYPGHPSQAQARLKLRAFLNAGIRHFVDLTETDESLENYQPLLMAEAQDLRVAVTYVRIPIRDYSVPQRPDVMRRILDTINANVKREGITYVHCWGGVGRTGLVMACWLQEHGRTADEALAELARLWQTNEKSNCRPRSPETPAQVVWVRGWHRHRHTAAAPPGWAGTASEFTRAHGGHSGLGGYGDGVHTANTAGRLNHLQNTQRAEKNP